MKIPFSYIISCPNCKQEAGIQVSTAHLFWNADTCWKCPYCREHFTTAELDKKEQENANPR
jgi:hypothetical protein